jgi:hypothetical protein
MNDFLGKQLDVGDHVVLVRPNYREFVRGTVVRFTKCYAIVEYVNEWTEKPTDIKQAGKQLIIIGKEDDD